MTFLRTSLLLVFLLTLCGGTIEAFAQCSHCTSLDEALKKPKKVVSLKFNAHMQGTDLESLPPAIGELVNVQTLYLSDHSFTSIPSEIGQLKKLRVLSFAGCPLTSIPDELFQLKNLKEVILLSNNFSEEYKEALREKFKRELPRVKLMLD